MINSGNKIQGVPYLVKDKTSIKLERIPFSKKEYSESWIQDFIHKHPDVIPTEEFDPIFSQLIPIGKEVTTDAGYIDNLYISPQGYLTIVETKLWRNPESRREVVGQILDYAKVINKWTFTELDECVKSYNQSFNGNDNGIIDTIRIVQSITEVESVQLIDRISRSLRDGRFLLLIVGDGIKESAEELVDYLNQTPQLNFTMGMIELKIYSLDKKDSSLVVIPQVVTKTKEIVRAVVRFDGDSPGSINISVDTKDEEVRKTSKRFIITEEDYFNELESNTDSEGIEFVQKVIESCKEKGYLIEWRQGSFTVMYLSAKNRKLSLFGIYKSGDVYMGWGGSYFDKLGLSREPYINFVKNTANLFKNIEFDSEKCNWSKTVPLYNFIEEYDDFMHELENYIKILPPEI